MKPRNRILPLTIVLSMASAVTLPLSAQTWNGGGSDDNWGTGGNWGGSAPTPGNTTDLTFGGTTRLNPINNYTAWDDFRNIIFASGAGAFNITGNQVDLFGKIENLSSNLQTFGLEFSFNSGNSEINPVDGDLLINGANIFNNGNTINIWGNNGRTVTLDTVIQGAGGLVLQQNSTAILAKNNSYSGANTITAGTLQIGNGGSSGNFGSGSMTIGANGTLAFNRTGTFNLGAITTSAGAKVRVDLGTVTGTAATSFGSQAAGNIVEVTSGGAINLNGVNRSGNHMNLTIAGDGGGAGAIHNTGGAVYSNSGVRNLTLSNNATVTVGGSGTEGNRWDLLANGTLNLAGFNLTKNGGGNFVIRSTPGSGGTITVSAGTIGFEDNFTGAGTADYSISVAAGAAIGGFNGREIRSAITLNGTTAALYDQGGTRSSFTNVTLNNGGFIDQSNRVYGTSGNGIGINGTMGGTGNLVVSGGDRGLYLAGTHSFTGVTTINIQSGHIEINGNANGGNLVSNAVLNLATTANTTRAMDLWAGNAEFRGLTGGNNDIRIVGNNATTRTLTINTPEDESYTYSGIFQNRTWNTNASPYNLVKTGAGTQTFNNQNSTWSGALTINGGTLIASGASDNTNTALGLSNGSRTVTINNGGTLQLGSNNVFGGGAQTLANTIKVAINAGGTMRTGVYNVVGNIDLNGGTLTSTGGSSGAYQSYEFNGSTITVGGSVASTISASGSNSGMHIAGNSTLTLNVADVTGDSATDLTLSAALINGSNDRSGTGALLKTGVGTVTLSGSSAYTGGTTLSQGTIIASNGNALGTGGTVTINDTNTGANNTSLLTSGNLTIARPITVADEGSGITTIGSLSLASGNQAIFSGAITLAKDVTLQGAAGGDRTQFSGGISGTGNVTIGGTGRIIFLGGANTYAGSTTINGILQLGDGSSTSTSFIPDSSTVTVNNGAFLRLAKGNGNSEAIGGLAGNGTVEAIAGNNTLAVGSGDATASFGGVLRNNGATLALTKIGSGTQILTGINTYTGATLVNAGALEIAESGSINGTSSITVAGGARLIYNSSVALTVAPTLQGSAGNRAIFTGSGSVNAAMSLTSLDHVLAPGNSPGIQSFGTSQTWESFTYEWEVNDWADATAGVNYDTIQINGSLTLTGNNGTPYALNLFSLNALNAIGMVGSEGGTGFSETNNSWTILSASGGIAGFDSSLWMIDTTGFADPFLGTWALALGNDDSELVLTYTAIPEPKTAVLGCIGLMLLFRRRVG